jgi:tetratricopeptide (TPR) repeat protein
MMKACCCYFLVLLCLVPTSLPACMWDYDTLQMERQRFRYAQELIAGQFLRHSDAYYQWRIEDRSAKPTEERTPADYDDLAVAYEKLGEHDRAIEIIQEKITRWPEEGRYESEANLGTFLIHAGRYEAGLEHIERAIEINPEAHFGREVYQKLLVEYVLQQRAKGATLPLKKTSELWKTGFARFVLEQRKVERDDEQAEIQKAVKGVLGMMQFGNYRSPILLEALGDLLMASYWREDAKLLAARAYLKAGYEAPETAAKDYYRERAKAILETQVARNLEQIEAELKREIAQGEAYYAGIVADETAWAAAGENLDRRYGETYYQQPELTVDHTNYPADPEKRAVLLLMSIAGGFVLLMFIGGVLILR